MATSNQGNQGQKPGEKVEIDVGDAHVEITTGGNQGGNQSGAGGGNQGNRGQASAGDNRGKVLHPETDGRLKGNEAHRPNDPDRSAQSEGGRRGGQNSGGGNNDR